METQTTKVTTCTQRMPRVGACFFCLTPGAGTVGREPCEACAAKMTRGVILLSTDTTQTKDPMNPYRTGAMALASECAVRRMFRDPDFIDRVLATRYVFLDDTIWDSLGISRT